MKVNFPSSIVEVDLDLALSNLREIKKRTGGSKILSVVKCNAYSHGVTQISNAIKEETDWFAVANVDEGIQLRMAGIRKPILVFATPDFETAAAYQTHNLTATISDFTHFSILMDGTSYHLNFDTGMGRLGFTPEDAEEVRRMAVMNQRLVCSGLYSHYATADDPGSGYVDEQHAKFRSVLTSFGEIPLIHMSNTGAAVNYPDLDHFDMIRTGLGILGYSSGTTRYDWLKPVMKWSTELAQVRKISRGDAVSYGSTWKAPEDGWLATLPVGYGDGVPRALSNKLHIWIDGEFYPLAGRVTMDMLMVYLGEKKLPLKSEAHLLCGNGWNAHDWAEAAETNIHEILTRVTNRPGRIFRQSRLTDN